LFESCLLPDCVALIAGKPGPLYRFRRIFCQVKFAQPLKNIARCCRIFDTSLTHKNTAHQTTRLPPPFKKAEIDQKKAEIDQDSRREIG
jgi:hypothetical protein